MTARIVQKVDNQIAIYNDKRKLLKEFELKENLQRNLQFLKQINSLKTIDRVPIYQTKMINGISAWSFHQAVLFRNFLWDYTRYEEIIRFLFEHQIKKVALDVQEPKLESYLEKSGIKVIGKFRLTPFIKSFFSVFLKLIGQIISLLAIGKLIISRTSLLVYTPDKFAKKYGCDFRFHAVYQYLREKRITYLEAFHTLFSREFLRSVWQRKRLAIYLEAFPFFFIKRHSAVQNYDLSVFEAHNRRYLQCLLRLIDYESAKSIKRIKSLSRLLKLSHVKTLVAIDDVRYVNELVVACKFNKIKTYGFQHGLFSKYHVGWMNYGIPKELSSTFDKLFIWNDYCKKTLLDYSTQYEGNNVEISGSLKELKPINYQKKPAKLPLKILVPYESYAPKKEVKYYLDKLLILGSELFFKPRPDASINSQLKEYGLGKSDKLKIIKEIDENVLSQTDAVVGTYTAFLNEMIFYEKPIFIVETSLDLGHRLIEDKLGFLVKKNFQIEKLLDYVKNYQSKKDEAWPPTLVKLRDILEKLNL